MNVVTKLQDLPDECAFTIGMFDGVHVGHQYLLHQLCSYGLPSVVLTFPEHPKRVLGGEVPKLITPLQVKLALLETLGVTTTVVVPFTKSFASTSFDELLGTVPVKQLVFGKGAVFGKGRLGDETAVRGWAEKRGVQVAYVEKKTLTSSPVSSSRIRELIEQGNLSLAETLLGHPHLLYVPPHVEQWNVSDLALPREGTYSLSPSLTAQISKDSIHISQPQPKPAIYPLRNPS